MCPDGSGSIGWNKTANYCDGNIATWTEILAYGFATNTNLIATNTTANNALPKSGGTINGNININGTGVVNLGITSTGGSKVPTIYLIRGNKTDSSADYYIYNSGGTLTIVSSISGVNNTRLTINAFSGAVNVSTGNLYVGTGNMIIDKGYLRVKPKIYDACTAITEGQITYNGTTHKHMACNSTQWVSLY
jgi:hypothetical protein